MMTIGINITDAIKVRKVIQVKGVKRARRVTKVT